MDQGATWYGGRLRLRGHCVRWGPSSPSQKGSGTPSPILAPCILWPNGWIDQDGTWHGGESLSRPHCARWGPSSPPPKRGQSPQFSAHFYCGQTAGCFKMPLDMNVGISPGDFVIDGDTALTKRGGAPNFRPTSIVAKRLHG